MSRCCICLRFLSQKLSHCCWACQKEIADLRDPIIHKQLKIISLYKYEGVIRELIHRSKISCAFYPMQLISSLFKNDAAVSQMMQGADLDVFAMPQSRWSRLRGKWSIAHELTHSCKRKYSLKNTKNLKANIEGFLKKSALQAMRQPISLNVVEELRADDFSLAKSIVVDDVVMSGGSFQRIQQHRLLRNNRPWLLSFSYAFSQSDE